MEKTYNPIHRPERDQHRPKTAQTQIVYGLRPVIEALDGGVQIERVLLQKDLTGQLVGELRSKLRQSVVPVQYVPAEKLAKLTTGNHQGVVATVAPIRYHTFAEMADGLEGTPIMVVLDHVTDVRNLGAIARTAECAGASAIVVPDHGSAALNDDAIKTSSGALLRLPVCREANLKSTILLAKQYGYQIVAATEKASRPYTEIDFCKPTFLVMGAEEKGISPELLRLADVHARLPIVGQVQSLNVSVATGVFLYEALRQRTLNP
ncbi:MAG: 23S rRNA (guanosine(2251)-2'-O)-methyltransferase RlmB [Bacteroidales bacterium]|nr:23S rRNA (guanosine(2251)-2'-O)-methyltransferase RlmB [Bacteroidales bacterium]